MQTKEDQSDEIANFFSGKGGVITSVGTPSSEFTGGDVTATEPGPPQRDQEVVQRDQEEDTVEKDSMMVVEYPSQVEQDKQSEQTGQTGLDGSKAQINYAFTSSTRADLTSTDPRLARVLPFPASVVGATPTYYQAPSAVPLSTVSPQAPSSLSAPPLSMVSPPVPSPSAPPPSHLSPQFQVPPPAYNQAMMGGVSPVQPHPPPSVCRVMSSSGIDNDNSSNSLLEYDRRCLHNLYIYFFTHHVCLVNRRKRYDNNASYAHFSQTFVSTQCDVDPVCLCLHRAYCAEFDF